MSCLLSLHGIDNAGKTTQARLLQDRLIESLPNRTVEIITFPQVELLESTVANLLRDRHESIESDATTLMQSREYLWLETIKPKLDDGEILILPWATDPAVVKFMIDRWNNLNAQIENLTLIGDLIFCLDVASPVAAKRGGTAIPAIYELPQGMMRIYVQLSNNQTGKIERINSNTQTDIVATQIWRYVEPKITDLLISRR